MEISHQERLRKTRDMMESEGVDVLLLLNTRNIYWLSGSAQASHLLVFRDRDPVLLVRRNIELARQHSWFPGDWILPLKSTRDTLSLISEVTGASGSTRADVGLELGGLPASFFLKIKAGLPGDVSIKNVSGLMRRLRMVKDPEEQERVRRAGAVATKTQDVVYEMLIESYKKGVSEADVAAEMVRVARKNHAEHFSIYDNNMFTNYNNFFIVTSGDALWTPSTFPIMSGRGFSPAIPYGPSARILEVGDMVVCDYAMIVDGYHSDHARTYVVNGVYPEHFKERYENLRLAYERTLDHVHEGIAAGDVFVKMRDELQKLSDPVHGSNIVRFFQGNGTYHQGLGHGIGLELDEPPFLLEGDPTPLEAGMTISIEPKIMIPGWGAINFEDNFIIRKNGRPEQVTRARHLEW